MIRLTGSPSYTRQSKNAKAILSCSKAARGLLVLVEIGRVFTATAISPSEGSRQLLARYAFRAGHQLSDKELRYRRTVIVTAAVYRSFASEQNHINAESPIRLTYRHWAGVSPYTSSFEFARTCVFDKQSTSNHSLRPHLAVGQPISLSYG